MLSDGDNALLVPPGDGEALLAALAKLVADAGLRETLGRAARRTIEDDDLTWRGNARRVTDLAASL